MSDLTGRTIAFIATRGVEEPELAEPWKAVTDAGATARLLSPRDEVESLKGDWDHGKTFPVDGPITGASADDYDALVIPGGTLNADALRIDEDAVRLAKDFASAGKPMFVICHAPWVLINADLVNGRRMTSYVSVREDLENAGAQWVDEQVVVDGGVTTSRNPGDLEAFNAQILEQLGGSAS